MDKPLKDWTLGEVKDYCQHHDYCDGCKFEDKHDIPGSCVLDVSPDRWDLSDPPRWTEDEIALAKLLIKAGFKCITCFGEYNINLINGEEGWFIPKALFPSLRVNESVELVEIVGDGG